MKVFNHLTLLIFLSACKQKARVDQQTEKEGQSTYSPFNKDTLLNLYELSLIAPKGWRFANDDTLGNVADATARYRFHNRNEKLIHLAYGLGTIGNPAEPNVQSFRFRKGYMQNA